MYAASISNPSAISDATRLLGRPPDEKRMTLPDIMRGLEEQTNGMVNTEQFAPPGCEHALCSFHGNYLRFGGRQS